MQTPVFVLKGRPVIVTMKDDTRRKYKFYRCWSVVVNGEFIGCLFRYHATALTKAHYAVAGIDAQFPDKLAAIAAMLDRDAEKVIKALDGELARERRERLNAELDRYAQEEEQAERTAITNGLAL